MTHQNSINSYLTIERYELETVAETIPDYELTILDKDVLIIKIEDKEHNKKIISYEVHNLTEISQIFLNELQIGQKFSLKKLFLEKTLDLSDYSKILTKDCF